MAQRSTFRWLCVRVVLGALLSGALATSALAQESYPMLMRIHPLAVQAGQTSPCEVEARYNLAGAYQVLVSGTGVAGTVPPLDPPAQPTDKPATANKLKVLFAADANAELGPRDVRIATPQGASTIAQMVVVRDPVISELAPDPKATPPIGDNDTLEGAQPIALPAVVCGLLDRNEDIDRYRFHAEAGQTLVFHVIASRLQHRIHDLQPAHCDPIITLRTAGGVTLASCDNYFAGDPLLSHTFATAGDYLIEVRDVRYQGNAAWVYALEINPRPFLTNVFPLAVARDTATEVELVGPNVPADVRSLLTVPTNAIPGRSMGAVLAMGDTPTNPVAVWVSDLAPQLETSGANDEPAAAQEITWPAVVNGRNEQAGDVDNFKFQAKQADQLAIQIIARRLQSELDPYLRVLNEKGDQLVEADDSSMGHLSTSDPVIDNWTAPADGTYVLQVRDLHLRGGRSFPYVIKIDRVEPSLVLECDTDKTPLSPGTNSVLHVRPFRKNGASADIELTVEGLPQGVTATCGRILAGGIDGTIVLCTAADAPQATARLKIRGRTLLPQPDGSTRELWADAVPLQETYIPGGGRNHVPVEMQTVSVDAPREIKAVAIDRDTLTLKPGESQKIEITITRREGFTGNVMLDSTMNHLGSVYGNSLPPGVTLDAKNSKTLLTGSETQGHIVLVAAADAKPVERQLTAIMAGVSINFVMKMIYASGPLWVTVAAP